MATPQLTDALNDLTDDLTPTQLQMLVQWLWVNRYPVSRASLRAFRRQQHDRRGGLRPLGGVLGQRDPAVPGMERGSRGYGRRLLPRGRPGRSPGVREGTDPGREVLPMSRAGMRAWKCRQGVHRFVGWYLGQGVFTLAYCRDCPARRRPTGTEPKIQHGTRRAVPRRAGGGR
jgi:hypothetical protein